MSVHLGWLRGIINNPDKASGERRERKKHPDVSALVIRIHQLQHDIKKHKPMGTLLCLLILLGRGRTSTFFLPFCHTPTEDASPSHPTTRNQLPLHRHLLLTAMPIIEKKRKKKN
jgi:hypothetical protein